MLLPGLLCVARAGESRKVLVLHSYHQGFDWTDSIQQALARSLAVTDPDVELYVEYMNSKRQPAEAVSERLAELYRQAYARVRFDAIVASDNNALDFLLRYRDTLFPGVPVVFCGINNVENYRFAPDSGYTGVSEAVDVGSTLDVALRLHPQTRKVALLVDGTETGDINLQKVHAIADRYPGVDFFELSHASAERLSEELVQLTDEAIVLNLGFYRDDEGRNFSARESREFILAASSRPVFTLWDFAMAPGAAGGKLLSGRLQGENAARLLTQILQGEPPSSLPVIMSPTEYTFGYEALQRFAVGEDLLPAGALVVGKPDTFYSRYKLYLGLAAVLLTIQVMIIALLAWNIARRRKEAMARQQAVDALRESNEIFSRFMRFSPVYVFIKEVVDGRSRVLTASENFHELVGVPAGAIVGKTMEELFPAEAAARLTADDLAVDASGETLRVEEEVCGRFFTTIKFPIPGHNRRLLAGYSIDITERKEAEAEVLAARNKLQATLDAIPDLLFEVGLSGRIYNYHTRDDERLVIPAQDFLGHSYAEFLSPEATAVNDAALREALEKGSSSGKEYCLSLPVGQRWFEISVAPMPSQDDDDRRFILVARDVSERKSADERLHLAASVFSHAREGILITRTDGAIIDVNDSFSRITGYARDEVLGRNPRILKSGRQDAAFYADVWRTLREKGHWSGELWNRRKDGSLFAAMQTISTVVDAQGVARHYVALFSDVTKVKEHERYLERVAHYDVLTGLPNRVLLADRLQQAMAQTRRNGKLLATVYLDLDGFKTVNDRHGHEVGDQVLIALANRLNKALRSEDTLARLGGDEFVAVLLDIDRNEDCMPTLGRLLDLSAQPIVVDGVAHPLSASIGVSFFPQADEASADQLLRQADQAMYQAKLAGKNRYHIFDAVQDRTLRGRHESIEHIRRALGARQFVLHYQPKVNMRSGAVIGVEALIRWQHPQQGLLSPAAFLPVIENHPLAVEVGEWVIEAALKQIEAWRAAGLDLPVSVNVGARQLLQSDFVARLRSLLAAHPAVRPGDLDIEVLETSALEDLARTSQIIVDCHDLGTAFSLDDFGTGYSSLTYLKRLAVKQLKIDQSFVRDMLIDPDDLSILGGVLSLASAFRRQVVAEGVETVEHGTMLLRMGCEYAQGYGIARPMPADELPGWLAGWRPPAVWQKTSRLRTADLPLLFSIVEHRAWVLGIEAALRGSRELLLLDPYHCRFDEWLRAEGAVLYAGHDALRSIAQQHGQAHALADRLCDLHYQGKGARALEQLPELVALCQSMRDDIEALISTPPD